MTQHGYYLPVIRLESDPDHIDLPVSDSEQVLAPSVAPATDLTQQQDDELDDEQQTQPLEAPTSGMLTESAKSMISTCEKSISSLVSVPIALLLR
ncbi:hypothetical protein [Nocardia pseudobrasiliensis]|uniref:hypothetical protein n=1 Tax=Nocardia pseudobrasiliensis TaxID=45979 RepID=UPI000836F6E8|nr:hypothetical protein [Nocardia pseudobrasiliensis]